MENLTKSLLSNVKATKLKEIAKLTGVPKYTKMKKEELFNTMFAELKVASTVTFVSEGNSTFGYPCVLNKDNLIEKDEYSIEVSEPLNKWHNDFLTNAVQEDNNTDVVMYKVKGNILRINSLREYLFLMECFGSVDVNGIRELDLNSVRKEYDGVQFTNNCISECNVNEEYSLSHYKYGFVTILNDCDNVSYGKNIDASEDLLLQIKSELNDSLCNLRKREQFEIRNINILDLEIRKSNKGSVVVLPKNAGITVPTSENRMFRDYNEPEVQTETFNIANADVESLKNKFDNITINKVEGTITVTKTVNKVPSFIILNGVANIPAIANKEERKKLKAKRELLLDMIMLKGFYNEENGKLYRVVSQSASQQRLGKYIFTSQNWEEVRTKMLYGYDFGKEFVRTTKEARCGLAFTSALLVKDFHPSIKIIEDPWETVHSNVIIPTGVDKENHKVEIYDEENGKILIEKAEKDIIFQPNDGAAQMQIIPFARACYGIGIISRKEFKYLKDNYKDIFQMTEINNKNKNERTKEESKLLKIFNKLPAVLQIRYGGCKGLVIKFPIKDYRPDLTEDIIAGDNFVKFTLENYSNVNFEVCGAPKKEKNYALMNYQFLQFLNISAEDLCSMAEEQLDKISNNILKDAKEALKFLGMIEGISSDETTGIVSKFTKILATNPDMLQDVYVQKNIKDLMAKYVYNIAFGRMPVKGQYQFVISDPFHFLAEGSKDVNGLLKYTMNKNQNYSNGNEKKVALFRSPMTSGDEIQEIELTENKQLWFLKDVLVLNCYSLTLPGAGGADTDGDHMMIVEDERIINSIPEKRGIKFDEGLKGKKVVGSLKELLSHFRRCSEPSQIGTITNYNTTWNDMTKNGFGNYTPRCYALGFLQGWDIDKPKTGASVNIPEKFKTELKPHWLYLAKLFKMDSKKFIECGGIIKDIPETVYHSNSPLGNLCDYVLEKGRILLTHHSDTVNFTGALATTVDVNEVTNVYSTVEYLEKKYREELVDILAKYPERTTEDTMKIKQAMEELTSKYSLLLRSLPADNTSIAVACYKLCYGRNNQHNSNSKSFVWNCMFDEILECISKLSNGRKLVKLPTIDEDIEEVYVNGKGVMFYGNAVVRDVNIDAGTYKVITIGDEEEKYIYVERVNKVQQYVENVVEEEDKIYSIDVAGYARQNLTGIDVYKILEEKEFTIKLIDNIFNIIVDNKIVTGVRASSVLGIVNLNNKVLKAVEVQNPIFEPKRINDDTVWYDREENKAIRKSLNVKFKVIRECKDTNEEYYSKKGCTSDVEEFINEVPQTLEDCTTTAHKYTAEEVFGVSGNITNPFGCEYDVEITSKSYKELENGDLLGSVTLYKNGNSYLYEVIFSNNSLVVQSSVNFSATASTWIKSLVAVEFVMYM